MLVCNLFFVNHVNTVGSSSLFLAQTENQRMFASESSCAELYRVLRDGCANTQPLKEVFCKACAKTLLAPPPDKRKEIKFQPDALDIFLEHLGGKKHRKRVSGLQEENAWQAFRAQCGAEVCFNHLSGELRTTDGNQAASSSSSDRVDWTSWHQTIDARMKTSCLPQHDWKGPSDRGLYSSWSKIPGTCKDVLAENSPDKPMLRHSGSPRKLCEPGRVDISGNVAERARPVAGAKEQLAQDGNIEALEKHFLAAPRSASDLGRWLWVAAGHAQPSAVELLIRYRADVDYSAEGGRSALHEVSEEVLALLTENNANLHQKAQLNSRTKTPMTALEMANRKGHLRLAEVLSSLQADAQVSHAMSSCSSAARPEAVPSMPRSRSRSREEPYVVGVRLSRQQRAQVADKEKASLEEMLCIIRENWPAVVKMEDENRAGQSASQRPLGSQQLELIKAMVRGVRKFDPSRCPDAWDTWQHLAQRIVVGRLLFTHHEISDQFLHAPHQGERVTSLKDRLLSKECFPDDVTPLVVIQFMGELWVVCGNRRLKAFKDFQKESRQEVLVTCIVHDLDGTITVPHALVAKFVDACSTQVHGMHAAFRQRHRRRHSRF